MKMSRLLHPKRRRYNEVRTRPAREIALAARREARLDRAEGEGRR